MATNNMNELEYNNQKYIVKQSPHFKEIYVTESGDVFHKLSSGKVKKVNTHEKEKNKIISTLVVYIRDLGNKTRHVSVHNLIGATFNSGIPSPVGKLRYEHIDDNYLNNNLNNLRENIKRISLNKGKTYSPRKKPTIRKHGLTYRTSSTSLISRDASINSNE